MQVAALVIINPRAALRWAAGILPRSENLSALIPGTQWVCTRTL